MKVIRICFVNEFWLVYIEISTLFEFLKKIVFEENYDNIESYLFYICFTFYNCLILYLSINCINS